LSGGEARRRQEALLEAGALAWVVPLLFGYDATLEGRAGAPPPGASAVQELAAADGMALGGAAAAGACAGRAEGAEGADSGPAFLVLGGDRNVDQARGAPAAPWLRTGCRAACRTPARGMATGSQRARAARAGPLLQCARVAVVCAAVAGRGLGRAASASQHTDLRGAVGCAARVRPHASCWRRRRAGEARPQQGQIRTAAGLFVRSALWRCGTQAQMPGIAGAKGWALTGRERSRAGGAQPVGSAGGARAGAPGRRAACAAGQRAVRGCRARPGCAADARAGRPPGRRRPARAAGAPQLQPEHAAGAPAPALGLLPITLAAPICWPPWGPLRVQGQAASAAGRRLRPGRSCWTRIIRG